MISVRKFLGYNPDPDYCTVEKNKYHEGFIASLLGAKEIDNPYKTYLEKLMSFDCNTTLEDDCHFAWDHGFQHGKSYLENNFP